MKDSLNALDEIEKINNRMALGIDQNSRQTRDIASLEEKTREMQIKKEFPTLFSHQSAEQLITDNRSIDTEKPLSQQITEAYKASDLKAYYTRDLDTFNMLLRKSNGSLKGISFAQSNGTSRNPSYASIEVTLPSIK